MPNITVTVDEPTYRNARIWAAIHNTTVSVLVREFLHIVTHDSLGGNEPQPDLPAGRPEDPAPAINQLPVTPDFEQKHAEIEPFLGLFEILKNI